MENQAFLAQSESQKHRKLEVVLRQLAGDRLTEAQRQMIGAALGSQKQSCIQISPQPGTPVNAFDPTDEQLVVRPIFGSASNSAQDPTAVLVQSRTPRAQPSIVYIYLPKK